MSIKNVLFIFKDRKSVTLNNDFWSDKFKYKFNVTQFFLNDNLRLSNIKIINLINEIITSKKINLILFEGDHAHIIDYKFIKNINKNIKKGIFLGDDMVWHNLNLITAQSCDFVFSSCPISALKFQEIGTESFFVPIECNDNLLKDYKEKKIYDVLHFGRDKTNIDKLEKEYPNFFWTPRITFAGLLDVPDEKGETKSQGPVIGMGIDFFTNESRQVEIWELERNLVNGTLPVQKNDVLISSKLADKLNVYVGEQVTFIGSTMDNAFTTYNYNIVGTFNLRKGQTDRQLMLVDISGAREALDMDNAASAIFGFTHDLFYDDALLLMFQLRIPSNPDI